MSISREEFEQGEPELSVAVRSFLRDHVDRAFSLQGLLEALLSRGLNVEREALAGILEDLVQRGRVESRERRDIVYYIYSWRLGFRPR